LPAEIYEILASLNGSLSDSGTRSSDASTYGDSFRFMPSSDLLASSAAFPSVGLNEPAISTIACSVLLLATVSPPSAFLMLQHLRWSVFLSAFLLGGEVLGRLCILDYKINYSFPFEL
jgi:hypothetical protein